MVCSHYYWPCWYWRGPRQRTTCLRTPWRKQPSVSPWQWWLQPCVFGHRWDQGSGCCMPLVHWCWLSIMEISAGWADPGTGTVWCTGSSRTQGCFRMHRWGNLVRACQVDFSWLKPLRLLGWRLKKIKGCESPQITWRQKVYAQRL